MLLKRIFLYRIVLAACTAAGLWLFWNVSHYKSGIDHTGFDVCLFKRVTGIPCPSCGSTRSLLYLIRFDLKDAIYANPIGLVLAFALLVFPVWVLYDIIAGKDSFYRFYGKMESFIRRRWVTISLICLIAANWLWNIHKYY